MIPAEGLQARAAFWVRLDMDAKTLFFSQDGEQWLQAFQELPHEEYAPNMHLFWDKLEVTLETAD